ncbi:MAG: hypothetical protein WD557_08330 [Dehalococcoidia bacterium]
MERPAWLSPIATIAAIVLAACGSDHQPRIPDHLREAVRDQSTCSPRLPVAPSTGYHFDARGQPYPTPAGNRVEPSVNVPSYPGSVEVDGFQIDRWSVQVFEVDATERELFGFFEKAMIDVDLVAGGFGGGDFGRRCNFVEYSRNGSRLPFWAELEPVAIVSTQVPDPENERPVNGFPGSTIVYAAPKHGNLVYYVLTRR